MATPISEQIAVKVKARLALISTGSGYETTVSSVVRPTRIDTTSPLDYQIKLTQGEETVNDDFYAPGNPPAMAFDLPFTISAILAPSEADTTAADTLRNTFRADVMKALTVPASGDWAQWDGLAINSRVGSVTPYMDSQAESSGFQMELIVTYRVDENDPYTVRA